MVHLVFEMLSISNRCAACSKVITNKKYLKCASCLLLYEITCCHISTKKFCAMTKETKLLWKCNKCITKVSETVETRTSVKFVPVENDPQKNTAELQRNISDESLSCVKSIAVLSRSTFTEDSPRSLPNLSVLENTQIFQLKDQVETLTTQLLRADEEIDKLHVEVKELKQVNEAKDKKIVLLSKLVHSTTLHKRSHSAPRKGTRHCRQISGDFIESITIPIASTPYVTDKKSAPVQGEFLLRMSSTEEKIETTLPQNRDLLLSQKNANEPNKNFPKLNEEIPFSTIRLHRLCKPKHRVMIFADEVGKGIRNGIQALLGKDYDVNAIIKPQAPMNDILSSCYLMCSDFTSSDFILILGGSNDNNPVCLRASLYFFLSILTNTNVIVCNAPNSNYLSLQKLNSILKSSCRHFKNVIYREVCANVATNYKFNVLYTCRLLLREILHINFKIVYINSHKKENNIIVSSCTQTCNELIYKSEASTETNDNNLPTEETQKPT